MIDSCSPAWNEFLVQHNEGSTSQHGTVNVQTLEQIHTTFTMHSLYRPLLHRNSTRSGLELKDAALNIQKKPGY